jgi:hypothetical protein
MATDFIVTGQPQRKLGKRKAVFETNYFPCSSKWPGKQKVMLSICYPPPFPMVQRSPLWARSSSLSRLYDRTQAHHNRKDFSGWVISPSQRPLWMSDQPVAETSLDEWSVRRRDLYLTKHISLTRQTSSTPPAGFEPTLPASDRPRTHTLDKRSHWDRPLHTRSCETDSTKGTQDFAGSPKRSLSLFLVTSTL